MRILDLETPPKFFIEDNVFSNLDMIVKKYGLTFKVRYDDKVVPIIIKRYITKDNSIYNISIDYDKMPTMDYYTLVMTIDEDTRDYNTAYIAFINKNAEHNLTGSYIVRFAIRFLKMISVQKIALTDAATLSVNDVDIDLSPYLMLKSSSTFYGKFGFKPVITNDTTAYESNEDMLKRLCSLVSRLQKVKVKSLINYVDKLQNALAKADVKTIEMFHIGKSFDYGIKRIIKLRHDYLVTLNTNIEILQPVLQKYKTFNVVDMVKVCTLSEYHSFLKLFQIPSKIVIQDVVYLNKNKELFDEIGFICDKFIYLLDTTKKIDSKTCIS